MGWEQNNAKLSSWRFVWGHDTAEIKFNFFMLRNGFVCVCVCVCVYVCVCVWKGKQRVQEGSKVWIGGESRIKKEKKEDMQKIYD